MLLPSKYCAPNKHPVVLHCYAYGPGNVPAISHWTSQLHDLRDVHFNVKRPFNDIAANVKLCDRGGIVLAIGGG